MTWHPASRTPEATAIHGAAVEDRKANPRAYSLDPADVLERALERGMESSDDFLPGWREALEVYCTSAADDGRLNALGTRATIEQAASKLASVRKVTAALEAHPDRAGRLPQPPIVIIGGWRTGTTFLFRLLATDPRLRAPLPMDLTRPWRFGPMPEEERQAVLARLDAEPSPLHVLNPELRAIHDHGPRLAEECVLALGADLRSWGMSSTVRLERYTAWLATQDFGPSYREYRRVLRLLDAGDRRRFVLKAPAHTAELPALVDTFPGAVVVHIHRDVVETVASGASLFAVFRSTYSDQVDPVDVGRFQTDQTELWFRRAATYRRDPRSAAATFVDLAYRDLVTDPAAAIGRVYDAAGMNPPADPQGFIEAYHRANPRHGHGPHRYSPEDFGLDPDAVRERFADIELGSG